MTPTRNSDSYAYGLIIDSDTFFTGGAAQKSYMFQVGGDRTVSNAATGDSNDAVIKLTSNNYAANDSNFILRGYNGTVNNRSGGTLGRLEGALIGAQNKSGATVPTLMGVTIVTENYGTSATLLGGIDLYVRNEAAVATTEFGIRITNDNRSTASAVDAAIILANEATNTGFTYGIDMNGVEIATADIRLSGGGTIGNATILIPVRASGSYAYGVKIDSDTFFTGGAAEKSYMFQVGGDRTVSNAATGDSNDAIIKASSSNYAANDSNFILRGYNGTVNNRSGGTLGRLEGALIGAQNKSGATVPTLMGVTIVTENYGTSATLLGGIDLYVRNEAAVATTEFGIRITNDNRSTASAVDAAIILANEATNTGFTYGIDMNGVEIATADIRLSGGAMIFTGSAANGDAVYAEVGSKDATGSIYLTTAGALYVQVANAGAAADWYKVTTTDAD